MHAARGQKTGEVQQARAGRAARPQPPARAPGQRIPAGTRREGRAARVVEAQHAAWPEAGRRQRGAQQVGAVGLGPAEAGGRVDGWVAGRRAAAVGSGASARGPPSIRPSTAHCSAPGSGWPHLRRAQQQAGGRVGLQQLERGLAQRHRLARAWEKEAPGFKVA